MWKPPEQPHLDGRGNGIMHAWSQALEGSHSSCQNISFRLHSDILGLQQMADDWLSVCSEEAAKQKHDAEKDLCQLQQKHTTVLASATAGGSSLADLLRLQSQLAAVNELCKKVWQKFCPQSTPAQCLSSASTHPLAYTLPHPIAHQLTHSLALLCQLCPCRPVLLHRLCHPTQLPHNCHIPEASTLAGQGKQPCILSINCMKLISSQHT